MKNKLAAASSAQKLVAAKKAVAKGKGSVLSKEDLMRIAEMHMNSALKYNPKTDDHLISAGWAELDNSDGESEPIVKLVDLTDRHLRILCRQVDKRFPQFDYDHGKCELTDAQNARFRKISRSKRTIHPEENGIDTELERMGLLQRHGDESIKVSDEFVCSEIVKCMVRCLL